MTKSDRPSPPRPSRPSNVLLATDLGPRSDRALDRAAQLAEDWKAQLHIVHCLAGSSARDDFGRPSDGPGAVAERRIRNDLGPAMERLQPRIHIEQGSPGDSILEIADRHECSLIVTGVARDETLGRRLLGDTVDLLARKSKVPVLVVRKRASGPYESVIAATDFSPASAEAVKASRNLFPDSQTILLHAYEIPFSGVLMNEKIKAEFQDLGEQAASEFLRSHGLPEDIPRIVEQGTPEHLLADHADSQGSLIVVGSHGASALSTMVLGSTARRILNRTDGDVLLVPYAKRDRG